MSVKTLLTDEIERRINTLEDVAMGGPEDKESVEGLAKLLDKLNEMEKIELDHQDKVTTRDKELELKQEQMKNEKIDNIVKNCLTATSIVGGFGLTVWGTIKSINFEKDGTITTIMGRGFIQKLLPKK